MRVSIGAIQLTEPSVDAHKPLPGTRLNRVRLLLTLALVACLLFPSIPPSLGQETDPSPRAMALRYLSGDGVTQSLPETVRLLTEAAEKGDREAMVDLGVLYERGLGVPEDDKKALRLFQQAGTCRAWLYHGIMYYYGIGDAKNLFVAGSNFQSASTAECTYHRARIWAGNIQLDNGSYSTAYSNYKTARDGARLAGDRQLAAEAEDLMRRVEGMQHRSMSAQEAREALAAIGVVAAVVGAIIVTTAYASGGDKGSVAQFSATPDPSDNPGLQAAAALIWLDGKF